MKPAMGIMAVLIAISGYIPYIKDTFSGKTRPHVFSWFLWALVSLIVFGIQLTNEGGFGSLPNLVMGVICIIIFVKSLKNGTKDIKKIDILALALALISLILWLVIKQPIFSIILIVIVDLFSFLPTFIKSWNKPEQETLITWIMNVIRQVLIIFSLSEINLATALYPTYAFIATFSFVLMLIVRRKINPEF